MGEVSYKGHRASSAYTAAPSARTASSNTACAEWLVGAVSGSVPGGQAPSMALSTWGRVDVLLTT